MRPDQTGWLTQEEQFAKGRRSGSKSIHRARKKILGIRRTKNDLRCKQN